jgi:hypothetical protein
MLIEELFSRGIMTMGPCPNDPTRQVGVFDSRYTASLPALRAEHLQQFRWIAGEWAYENRVPATRVSPSYTDIGTARYSLCDKDTWICLVSPDGREMPQITFDPFSKQWIYVLLWGSYGILRSRQGWTGNPIVFSGVMTMIGLTCDWRMTWTKFDEDAFAFVNEEQNQDGSWVYIDDWRFKRTPSTPP